MTVILIDVKFIPSLVYIYSNCFLSPFNTILIDSGIFLAFCLVHGVTELSYPFRAPDLKSAISSRILVSFNKKSCLKITTRMIEGFRTNKMVTYFYAFSVDSEMNWMQIKWHVFIEKIPTQLISPIIYFLSPMLKILIHYINIITHLLYPYYIYSSLRITIIILPSITWLLKGVHGFWGKILIPVGLQRQITVLKKKVVKWVKEEVKWRGSSLCCHTTNWTHTCIKIIYFTFDF